MVFRVPDRTFSFLPTPSARRATAGGHEVAVVRVISTHALREEGDRPFFEFVPVFFVISTHALREEGDLPCGLVVSVADCYFYPRPPRGGRPSSAWKTC